MTAIVEEQVRPTAAARSVMFVGLTTLLGVLVGAVVAGIGSNYAANATVMITGLTGPSKAEPNTVWAYDDTSRYVLARIDTFAAVAESGDVADKAAAAVGEAPEDVRGHINAVARKTTTLIDMKINGAPTPAAAIATAKAASQAAADVIQATDKTTPGAPARISATVVSVDTTAFDDRWREVRFLGLLGGVCGLLLGWLSAAIRRPGRWIETMRPDADRAGRVDQAAEADQSIQIEVLGVLLAGQSRKGISVVVVAIFGVFGYAFTGSYWPPLLGVLIAGVASFWDLRFAAFAIILSGVSVLPTNLSTFKVGPITPTVLEFAIGFGLLATIVKTQPGARRGPFTFVVLGVLGALVLGALIGFGRGAEIPPLAEAFRSSAVFVGFFVFREAFRGRAYHLLSVLFVNAALSSFTVLASLPLGLERLLVRQRAEFITGSDTFTDVARLASPVIFLWTPLLLIIAAGLNRLRAQWLLVIPAVLHMALSFNRSTWAPLVVMIILAAALRGGIRGMVVRGIQVVVAGALVLSIAGSGVLGVAPKAVAARFLSLVNGDFKVETSLSDRVEENGLALKVLKDEPVLGSGLGMPFGPIEQTYVEDQDRTYITPSQVLHNQYILMWALMGVAGLLAYGALGVRLAAYSWHLQRRLGDAAVVPIAASGGILMLAVQSTFQTNLLDPAAVITIGAMLALIELAGTRAGPDAAAASDEPLLIASGPPRRRMADEHGRGV